MLTTAMNFRHDYHLSAYDEWWRAIRDWWCQESRCITSLGVTTSEDFPHLSGEQGEQLLKIQLLLFSFVDKCQIDGIHVLGHIRQNDRPLKWSSLSSVFERGPIVFQIKVQLASWGSFDKNFLFLTFWGVKLRWSNKLRHRILKLKVATR